MRAGATFCRACGASEDSDWGDEAEDYYEEDDFDYDNYLAREFPQHNPLGQRKTPWAALISFVAFLLVLTLLWGSLAR